MSNEWKAGPEPWTLSKGEESYAIGLGRGPRCVDRINEVVAILNERDKLAAKRERYELALDEISNINELYPCLLQGEFYSSECQRIARAALAEEGKTG